MLKGVGIGSAEIDKLAQKMAEEKLGLEREEDAVLAGEPGHKKVKLDKGFKF